MKIAAIPTAVVLLLASLPDGASAHPGGLDAKGCHHDRKRGGYHCHRGAPSPAERPARPLTLSSGSGAYYANCTAARNAGAAPIRRGEPGYRPALDRDNDGVACE